MFFIHNGRVLDRDSQPGGTLTDFNMDDQDLGIESDDDQELDLDGSPADSDDMSGGPEGDGDSEGANKRINDLMSKWQTADAENAKLKALLAKQAKGQPAAPADPAQAIEFMRELARDQVYASDPRFARLGIEPGSIEGETPETMRASAKSLSDLITKIETDARNAALKKHGISPDTKGGSAPGKPVDYSSMSDDEFEKQIARAKGSL